VTTLVWLALAGGVGAVMRFALTLALPRREADSFPRAILVVNTVGSLVAGVTLGLVLVDALTFDAALVVWVGFCGGLTTFSTFAVETVLLGRVRMRLAWRNIAFTVILGLLAATVGCGLTQLVVGN
jgi:CrcB protein